MVKQFVYANEIYTLSRNGNYYIFMFMSELYVLLS